MEHVAAETESLNLANEKEANDELKASQNDAKFICNIPGCGKVFYEKSHYRQHIQLTCFLCHKKFTRKSHVMRHVRNVHKVSDVLSCDVCGETFTEPISLAVHNKEQHFPRIAYS